VFVYFHSSYAFLENNLVYMVVPNLILAIARTVGSYSVCVSTKIESTENYVLFKQTNFASGLVLL
jgi:hypothetical protein